MGSRRVKRHNRRKRVGALIRKEMDWIVKDKLSLFILFALPLLIIIPVGEAEPELRQNPVVWIIDQDNSEYSNALVDQIMNGTSIPGLEQDLGALDCLNSRDNASVTLEAAEQLLPTEFLSAYMIIPAGFGGSIVTNRSASVSLHVDGMEFVKQILTEMLILEELLNYQLTYQIFNSEVLYFPIMKPEELQDLLLIAAPMISGFALFATLNLVSSQAIVADVPLKRMLLTPAQKSEVIVAKTIAYLFFGALLTLLVMMIFKWGYAVFVQCTFIELFVGLMLTVWAGVSLGIMFSVLATSRLQAAQLFLFSFIMQMLLVQQLRIPGLVDYMPLELHRDLFVRLAYRGLTLRQCRPLVTRLLIENVVFVFIAIALYNRKKEDV